ncbi:hypothetical protein EZV61_17250 [Corallincola luteus]|uniref:Dinitrogenase iron-molybdenum cofactor biosynthesis domain-containing protein n=1 Tax=Corallincola luteus TaxID=1775177 RepID=A0ABY2AGM6_9GAMM|nr:NifB/NifX family molybdenum-iron cluster-binding protein [Corallincola luteus]TCI01717.1 hypothetical protein EZV61_17250 [Corallincola luteus]
MITAIPMDSDTVASHFSKATSFVFFNEEGKAIGSKQNPALRANCQGKAKLLQMLAEYRVERLVVRNIGEKMLQRLLSLSFSVFHLSSGRVDLSEVVKRNSPLTPLTHFSQGRPSINAHGKNKEGHQCCGHKHDEQDVTTEACCQENAEAEQCGCGSHGHHQGKGKGKGCGHGHSHEHRQDHSHGHGDGKGCKGGRNKGAGKCCHS